MTTARYILFRNDNGFAVYNPDYGRVSYTLILGEATEADMDSWSDVLGMNLVEYNKIPACAAYEIERLTAELRQWKLVAFNCGLYRADVPHSTPDEWQTAQVNAATALLNQRGQLTARVTELEADKAVWMQREGFLSGVVQGALHWDIPRELKDKLNGALLKNAAMKQK